MNLRQINAAAEVIYEAVDPNANIIFGALIDENMSGEIAITVIATGFPAGVSGNPGIPPPEPEAKSVTQVVKREPTVIVEVCDILY